MAFEDEIDLVSVAVSEVEHFGSALGGFEVGAEFGRDERFEELANKGGVAFEDCDVDVEQVCGEAGVCDVDLG